MKIIKPYISEKSVALAKDGKYTLVVNGNLTKNQVKQILREMFNVNVIAIWSCKLKSVKKTGVRGKTTERGCKKIIVELKEKQKIPGFEVISESEKSKQVKSQKDKKENKK